MSIFAKTTRYASRCGAALRGVFAIAAGLLGSSNVASAQPQSSGYDEVSRHISKPDDHSITRPAKPAAWAGEDASLAKSQIYSFSVPNTEINNKRAFDKLVAFLKTNTEMEYPIAIVPGSSEGAGFDHHIAWPQGHNNPDSHFVEPCFRSRLRHAFLLLEAGAVHTIVISGGSIDEKNPSYNEASYGFQEVVREYSRYFPASKGPLAERLIVDPWANHSEVNVRNGDRITRLVGLDRNLIVTDYGAARQGWFYAQRVVSTFDLRAKGQFGYSLGEFAVVSPGPLVFRKYSPKNEHDIKKVAPGWWVNSAGANPNVPYITNAPNGAKARDTAVIAHWQLRTLGELMRGSDQRWDLGPNDGSYKHKSFMLDQAQIQLIGKTMQALSNKLR